MLRRKKQKPQRQPSEPIPAPQLSASEDYALDLDEEPELDEPVQEEPAVLFDGPGKWEEVDMDDVQRIALNISRSAVPAAENAEVASRLAMQAAALEADNLDPLGLGRIDSRQLTLVWPMASFLLLPHSESLMQCMILTLQCRLAQTGMAHQGPL